MIIIISIKLASCISSIKFLPIAKIKKCIENKNEFNTVCIREVFERIETNYNGIDKEEKERIGEIHKSTRNN